MRSPLDKKWRATIESHAEEIDRALLKGLESAKLVGTGFVVIRKDRSKGYTIQNKTWDDVLEEIRRLGGLGPLGGDPKYHKYSG